MQFYFHANQIYFHKNGFALRLALKQRQKRTRKGPIDVSISCVCPVIDDGFRHNIVKVAVDTRGDRLL